MRLLVVDEVGDAGEVPLGREQLRRLRKVLRLRDGDPVEVVDPAGGREGTGLLRGERLEVATWRPLPPDPHPDLALVLAPLKGERLEWAALRAFELGLRELRLIRSARAQLAPPPRLMARLAAKARAACEQSGRRHLPGIHDAGELTQALAACRTEGRTPYLLQLGAPPLPRELATPAALLVGPEGGFAPEELAAAEAVGATPVGLKGHVLRAETAAVAGVTLLLERLGWL